MVLTAWFQVSLTRRKNSHDEDKEEEEKVGEG